MCITNGNKGMKHTYKMFEKELTHGNHVSYHFAYEYFETISPKNSKLYLYEKELKESVTRYFDIRGLQAAITTPNTTLNEDACFHIGTYHRFIDNVVRKYFHIKSDFPIVYFTKKIKDAAVESPYKCGYTYDVFKTLNHPMEKDGIRLMNLFDAECAKPIFASHFTKTGEMMEDEMNFEIIPHYTKENYFLLKRKLLDNFSLRKNVFDLYDRKFESYVANDFHYHVKIKLKSTGNTVKFYRTFPTNPYLVM